jgi:hypothetical protein
MGLRFTESAGGGHFAVPEQCCERAPLETSDDIRW